MADKISRLISLHSSAKQAQHWVLVAGVQYEAWE